MIEVCHLQARATNERLGDSQGQGKDVSLADLNVDNAELICGNGIKRAEQVGSLFKGNKAIYGDFALRNGIGNGTAQSLDILNGVELNAATVVQAKQTFQGDRIVCIVQIGYGNSLHICHCSVEDVGYLIFGRST